MSTKLGHLLGHHEFREIPIEQLFVDTAYQRDLNEAAIKRYVTGFDANMFEPVTVNERKNGNGKPIYALLDGQHRKATAQKLGTRTLTCRVLHVDAATEAYLFVRLNKDRIRLPPVQAFKAEIAAKNPACIEILKCLETRSLTIGKTEDKLSIHAVVALQTIYSRGGFVRLARVLDTIIFSWPEDERTRFAGQILLGLDEFLGAAAAADVAKVAEKLARVTPDQILARASKRWHGHRALGQTDKSIVDCVTESIEITYRATGRKAA